MAQWVPTLLTIHYQVSLYRLHAESQTCTFSFSDETWCCVSVHSCLFLFLCVSWCLCGCVCARFSRGIEWLNKNLKAPLIHQQRWWRRRDKRLKADRETDDGRRRRNRCKRTWGILTTLVPHFVEKKICYLVSSNHKHGYTLLLLALYTTISDQAPVSGRNSWWGIRFQKLMMSNTKLNEPIFYWN